MHKLSLLTALVVIGSSQASAVLFDFNSGDNGFVVTNPNGNFEGPWTYGAAAGVSGTGGWSTQGQVAQAAGFCTTDLTSIAVVMATTGTVTLSFDHQYSFEDPNGGGNWDGGAIYFSVNGGAFNKVLLGSFTANGYNGTVIDAGQPQFQSQLAGELAFVGSSGGVITSTAVLGSLNTGDSLKVLFRAAYDSNTSGGNPDWMIDNVSLNQANAVPEPFTMALGLAGAGAFVRRRMKKV